MSKEEKNKIVHKARLWMVLHGQTGIYSRCGLCKPFVAAVKNNDRWSFRCEKVMTVDLKTSSEEGVCVAWAKYR